nr:MAG TPA: hypothetical protein [Caudoviricetes sp.]
METPDVSVRLLYDLELTRNLVQPILNFLQTQEQ